MASKFSSVRVLHLRKVLLSVMDLASTPHASLLLHVLYYYSLSCRPHPIPFSYHRQTLSRGGILCFTQLMADAVKPADLFQVPDGLLAGREACSGLPGTYQYQPVMIT